MGAWRRHMRILFVGIAALAVISTVAEARDGCGRGWYYNGRRCVPQDEPGYYRPGDRRDHEDRGPQLRLVLSRRPDEGARYPPHPRFWAREHRPPERNTPGRDG